MSNDLPPKGEQAEAWANRLSSDPTAIVSLADHLLRTCGLAMRLGAPVDAAPLFELRQGLEHIPPEGPGAAPLLHARLLLDGGGMALAGMNAGQIAPIETLETMQAAIGEALLRNNEAQARQQAMPFLAGLVAHAALPPLADQPDVPPLGIWVDAALRIRQARWGEMPPTL